MSFARWRSEQLREAECGQEYPQFTAASKVNVLDTSAIYIRDVQRIDRSGRL